MNFELHLDTDNPFYEISAAKVTAKVTLAGFTIWTESVWWFPDDPARSEEIAWGWFAQRLGDLVERGETWSEDES
jgi:hypothetical protein